MMNVLRRRFVPLFAAVAILAAGCTPTLHLQPAEYANDPLCAEVSVSLPDSFVETTSNEAFERIWTDAQATAAWGDPASVILTCGIEPPGPSTSQCLTFNGVDWLIEPADDDMNLWLTSYGRTPAVQIFVDATKITGDAVLSDRSLSTAVAGLPQQTQCTTLDEATVVPDAESD